MVLQGATLHTLICAKYRRMSWCVAAQVFWNLIAQREEHFAAMDLVDKTAFPFPYAQVSHSSRQSSSFSQLFAALLFCL